MPMGRRYSVSEKAALVSRFENGNLNQSKFCKENDISPLTLTKFLKEKPKVRESQFLPVLLKQKMENTSQKFDEIVVNFPSGAQARIPQSFGPAAIAALFRGLL